MAVAKHERDREKALVQHLQSGQQRYQSAMSRVQGQIEAPKADLMKDRNYLVCQLEESYQQSVSGIVRKLVKEGRQAKMNICEESKQALNIYTDYSQFGLNDHMKVVEDAFVTLIFVVQVMLDVSLVLAPVVQEGNCSNEYARSDFEFNAAADYPGAEREPKLS